MASKGRYCFDIESSGLLDDSTVDYTASPWKLKDTFKIHCVVITDMDTMEITHFVQEECYTKFRKFVKDNVEVIVGHNIINFDLLACKAALGMDYTVGPDSWDGKPVQIIDTYVLSKVLNPDRRGHSIEYFGQLLGAPKIDWRGKAVSLGLIEYNAPKGAEFAVYHPEMLVYNEQDVRVNIHTYNYLMKEWGDWKWQAAFDLEQQVAEIITRQSHRGFWFDSDLAVQNVKELDLLMEHKRANVEPHLPPKPMGKTKLKEYIPGAKQFLMNGEPNANIIKWCAKHGGTIEKCEDGYYTTLYGKQYKLPIPQEPILSSEPSNIEDTTFIKGVLVKMGWKPSQYKERDLTVNTLKQKLSQEKFIEAVERYLTQTETSPFYKDRADKFGMSFRALRDRLMKHDLKKPLKVYTNPTFTVGQEKELDPTLEHLFDEFPYVKDIVEFLTYRHRRNSILGGGYDPEEDDEDDFETGFLPNVRSDGRIPTPADTCGCATGRMKHRVVANVPRVSSLYGEPMRSLFGVDRSNMVQVAYDFASLEARIQSHFMWRYDETKEYSNSLLLEKPNDCHTKMSERIAEAINGPFSRQSAKSVNYCCVYGGQPTRVAKTVGCSLEIGQTVFDTFWEVARPLEMLKDAVANYWKSTGKKEFIPGIDGRKLRTRSEHALLNTLFQSTGVICAKLVMVLQDRKFKELGYGVDFWKDDWKNKQYVQQLIAYHDEAQLEISKGLVRWKKFNDEAEQKVYCKENPEWIPVHSDKGWFAGWTPVNKALFEAVDETNKHFKINVPLAIDPQLGYNWSSCH